MVFNKVKQWLGIEGAKIEIQLPEELSKSKGVIEGTLKFSTLQTQQIQGVRIKLFEEYTRGRRKSKRTNEYELGEIELEGSFMVYPEESKIIAFELPFSLVKSAMDKMQDSGGLMGGIAAMAKKSRGVKSKYRLEVEALVPSTKLGPFSKKEVVFTS